jgi:hypothetical protein
VPPCSLPGLVGPEELGGAVGGPEEAGPEERHRLRQKEALWDLFQSECSFLYDHLMVLRNVSFFHSLAHSIHSYLYLIHLGLPRASQTHSSRRLCHVRRARTFIWKSRRVVHRDLCLLQGVHSPPPYPH